MPNTRMVWILVRQVLKNFVEKVCITATAKMALLTILIVVGVILISIKMKSQLLGVLQGLMSNKKPAPKSGLIKPRE